MEVAREDIQTRPMDPRPDKLEREEDLWRSGRLVEEEDGEGGLEEEEGGRRRLR